MRELKKPMNRKAVPPVDRYESYRCAVLDGYEHEGER